MLDMYVNNGRLVHTYILRCSMPYTAEEVQFSSIQPSSYNMYLVFDTSLVYNKYL